MTHWENGSHYLRIIQFMMIITTIIWTPETPLKQ